MADLDTLAQDNAGAIRKYTRAVVFVAPESAESIDALTEVVESGTQPTLKALPELYKPVGLIKKADGISFSAERDMSDVESLGYAAPTRRDVLSEASSMSFTPHETNRLVTALYHGLNLDNVVPDPETGEVSYAKPTTPPTVHYRVLVIGRDGIGAGVHYKAWFVPRGLISETSENAMSAEDEASYGMTLSATPDPVLGYSVKEFQAGAGFQANAAALGWVAPTP